MASSRPRDGLLSRIAGRLLGRRDQPQALPTQPRQGGSDGQDNYVPDDFRMAIDQMVGEDQGRFGIRPHVVSLVEYREAVGERWKKIADKVMLIAEGVINLHLGAGNIFSRQGTDFFILVFRNLPAEEARRRALIIAQELGTRLVGDQFQGIDIPLALAAELPMADAFLADGSLNMKAVAAAVSEVRSIVASSAQAVRKPATPPPAQARPPIATIPADLVGVPPDDPRWREFSIKHRKAADPQWQVLDSLPKAPPVPPPPPGHSGYTALPITGTSKMNLVWRPTWVADGETIGAYKAQVLRTDAEGQTPMEGAHAYSIDDFTIQSLDRFLIAGAMRDAAASERAGNGSSVVLPIHWRSLAGDNRMELVAPFADLLKPVRDSRVVIDLFGVPDDIDPGRLAEVIAANRLLCREVWVRTRLGYSRAEKAAKAGATGIGIDLAELPANQKTDDSTLLAWLDEYLGAANRAGLGAYVWSVRRRHALIGAVQAGFAMVNGPALMKDIPRPAKVLPAPKARFALPAG
ncbi:hypothetical protein [Magnetospirillum moscoviense]|uniref:Uncharacterized protein n=1 Tax=Magnetospirillum moscoviense TaxID=1437059 RepID=A0A178MJS6_9PROT|nr:hypothetical protein [Magnetospirillum moscoviense]OAN48992.1 hypothetical protein A6A05_03125 [Magnetospirillum moscoviense]